MSYVLVILVDLDLSNDLPLYDLLLMDLSFFLLDDCGFSILFTVSIFLFEMLGVMNYFTTICFVPMSLIPSLKFSSVVVTNDFLKDIILVLDLIYMI